MPPRVSSGAPAPRWRSRAFAACVVTLGGLLAALGAFAAGGTTVRCERGPAGAVTCGAETTRWLGRSSLARDPIGSVHAVSVRVAERSERDPNSRDATATTRKRADWYLVLERAQARPWEAGGTREHVEAAAAALRALLDDPARREAAASLHDWAFAWAAMAVGAVVTLAGVRMLARAR